VKAISTGQYHTCVITATNGIKCWGDNSNGQLGDGTYNNSPNPVEVVGFDDEGENAIAISAGDDHTCALTSGGGVKCWGNDGFGQLGDGDVTVMSSSTPADVDGLASGVGAISAGGNHTCALTSGGGIKCWGNNEIGQLGFVTTEICGYSPCSSAPNFVDGFTDEEENAIDISAGTYHTCAITSTNAIKCWGYNEYGQLGNGTYNNSSSPVTVAGFSDDGAVVSAGYQHTCAVTASGSIKCWGYNSDGQLGEGTTYYSRITPVDVLGLTSGVKTVSAGTGHTCAVTEAGGLKCWGGNERGQLGWRLLWVPVDVIGFIEIVDFVIYLPVIVRK
jgi:alpha-tubulin suppressor-like RCC1 family protein